MYRIRDLPLNASMRIEFISLLFFLSYHAPAQLNPVCYDSYVNIRGRIIKHEPPADIVNSFFVGKVPLRLGEKEYFEVSFPEEGHPSVNLLRSFLRIDEDSSVFYFSDYLLHMGENELLLFSKDSTVFSAKRIFSDGLIMLLGIKRYKVSFDVALSEKLYHFVITDFQYGASVVPARLRSFVFGFKHGFVGFVYRVDGQDFFLIDRKYPRKHRDVFLKSMLTGILQKNMDR